MPSNRAIRTPVLGLLVTLPHLEVSAAVEHRWRAEDSSWESFLPPSGLQALSRGCQAW